MTSCPTISVLMPVYNARRYLRLAAESILAQTYRDFEFIAVDDGSTDGSSDILRELAQKDARLRVVSRPNTGIVGALNDGLALCRGTWVARMDADDWAYPQRFARQLAFLQEHPDYLALGTDYELMDEHGDPIETRAYAHEPAVVEQGLLGGLCCLQHPTVMLHRQALRDIGGYRREYQWVEDYDLFLRLAERGPLGNMPQTLLRYRVHVASVCHGRRTEQVTLLYQAQREARRRRGLAAGPAGAPPADAAGSRTLAQVHEEWARLAWRSGHYRTGFRHARKMVLRRPWQGAGWGLLWRCSRVGRAVQRGGEIVRRRGQRIPGLWRLFGR